MKTQNTTLIVAAVLALGVSFTSAHADWPCHFRVEIHPVYPFEPRYEPTCPPPSYTPAPRPAEARGDYPTHLLAAYRQGYWAGVYARQYGWARDSHGAWLAAGAGWESYFQEGYADGYDCHGMRH
jgi:hypothetical protein